MGLSVAKDELYYIYVLRVEGDADDGIWVFGIDDGEEYAQPPGWMGKVNLRPERIRDCPTDAALTIDAWDQS